MLPLRFMLLLLFLGLILGTSIAIPLYLGRGAQWIDIPAEEPEARAAFQNGYRLEREGNLEAALAQYRTVEKASAKAVKDAGNLAADRVTNELRRIGMLYPLMRTLSAWTTWLSLPILLTGLFAGGLVVVHWITPVSGIETRRFSIIPEREADVSLRFDRLLNEEISRIARAFRSDHLRRIGAAVTLSTPKADSELAGIESRAAAAIRQGELKAVVGFWLAEIVRRFQNIGFRPEFVLSGTVVLIPGSASSAAVLVHTRSKATSVIEASSAELADLEHEPLLVSPGPNLPPGSEVYSAFDHKETARHLAALASVVACKFFVRWKSIESRRRSTASSLEVESVRSMPDSWETVYDYVRALNLLEEARQSE